jgi:hypothetical protein
MGKFSKPSKQRDNYFPFWQQSSGRKQLFLVVGALTVGVARITTNTIKPWLAYNDQSHAKSIANQASSILPSAALEKML